MSLLDLILPSKTRDPRPPSDIRLAGPRVVLRMGAPTDWAAWRELRGLSRDFLKPWEPEWPRDALSRPFFEGMLRRHLREWREGVGYGFFIFLRAEGSEMCSSPLEGEEAKTWTYPRTSGDKSLVFAGEGVNKKRPPHQENLSELSVSRKFAKIFYPLPQGERSAMRHSTLIGGIGLNDVRRGIAQKATLGYWIGEPYARKGFMTEAAGLVCDFAFRALKLHRVEASCLPENEASKHLLKRLGFGEEGYAKSYLRIDGAWQDHVLWGIVENASVFPARNKSDHL